MCHFQLSLDKPEKSKSRKAYGGGRKTKITRAKQGLYLWKSQSQSIFCLFILFKVQIIFYFLVVYLLCLFYLQMWNLKVQFWMFFTTQHTRTSQKIKLWLKEQLQKQMRRGLEHGNYLIYTVINHFGVCDVILKSGANTIWKQWEFLSGKFASGAQTGQEQQ